MKIIQKNILDIVKHCKDIFTSCVFEVIDPKSFLKETKKYTSKTFSKDLSFHDYIMEDADTIDKYL